MEKGSYVEIRYTGKGSGRVEKGFIKKIHDDGEMDIEMEYPSHGIKFSVPATIVHNVEVTPQFHKIGRRAATTDIAAAVYLSPFELPLTGDWHVDSRAVVIPATKGRILRHRPMFDEWSVSFQVQIDNDLVSEKLVRDILEDSGKLVGLGDFRPARKGPYGRFSVVEWKKAK